MRLTYDEGLSGPKLGAEVRQYDRFQRLSLVRETSGLKTKIDKLTERLVLISQDKTKNIFKRFINWISKAHIKGVIRNTANKYSSNMGEYLKIDKSYRIDDAKMFPLFSGYLRNLNLHLS